jgi:hypothetical protein
MTSLSHVGRASRGLSRFVKSMTHSVKSKNTRIAYSIHPITLTTQEDKS